MACCLLKEKVSQRLMIPEVSVFNLQKRFPGVTGVRYSPSSYQFIETCNLR